MKRWEATVIYHSNKAPVVETVQIEELEELADYVENGPDWNAIESITLALSDKSGQMTYEDAVQTCSRHMRPKPTLTVVK